ncbi:MAG TPA: WYL domain-containing protein [Candidatus Onthocola stercorigallinarum]|nr:WYL domain-containing protein [Candidatus Onthocola stercorigallinarum]
MGKLSNMMYMIDLLNTGNIYTLKELSEKIGVTERMIRYYKNEICNNGIAIESFKGPNGGYFMIDKVRNYINVNKYDIQLLENIDNFLSKNNFKYVDKFREFLDKAKEMYSIYDEKSKYIFNIDIETPGEIEKIIESAIKKNEKIEIIYNDINGGQSQRTIHPLHLFKYKDEYYVTAFCELRNDIRHFELKRIVNIK